MAEYSLEFGKVGDTRPVPPLAITSDAEGLASKVEEYAIPHLKPALEKLGRPEAADCIFRISDADPSYGEFLWLDLAAGVGARFCPTRITTT